MPKLTITAHGDMDIDGEPCAGYLTLSEKRILLAVGRRRGIVTKEHLLQESWVGVSDSDMPAIKIVDVFICKIRKKIGPLGPKIIETVWGQGYQLAKGWQVGTVEEPDFLVPLSPETTKALYETAYALDRAPEELAIEMFERELRRVTEEAWS